MQKMNCLIIEDEPLAAGVLRDYIGQVPGLNLAAVCGDVPAALEVLRTEAIDLLFVDIHLPRVSGMEFVRSLHGRYPVIFTTAYHQYALDGFNVNAVDYLLKPIEFSRFLQAVNKVFEKVRPVAQELTRTDLRRYHFFTVDKKQVKVYEDEILYAESFRSYVLIHTREGSISTRFPIGDLEQMLGAEHFIRVHKSYLVHIPMVSAYTAVSIELGGRHIPVGRQFREQTMKALRERPY